MKFSVVFKQFKLNVLILFLRCKIREITAVSQTVLKNFNVSTCLNIYGPIHLELGVVIDAVECCILTLVILTY